MAVPVKRVRPPPIPTDIVEDYQSMYPTPLLTVYPVGASELAVLAGMNSFQKAPLDLWAMIVKVGLRQRSTARHDFEDVYDTVYRENEGAAEGPNPLLVEKARVSADVVKMQQSPAHTEVITARTELKQAKETLALAVAGGIDVDLHEATIVVNNALRDVEVAETKLQTYADEQDIDARARGTVIEAVHVKTGELKHNNDQWHQRHYEGSPFLLFCKVDGIEKDGLPIETKNRKTRIYDRHMDHELVQCGVIAHVLDSRGIYHRQTCGSMSPKTTLLTRTYVSDYLEEAIGRALRVMKRLYNKAGEPQILEQMRKNLSDEEILVVFDAAFDAQ